MEESSKVDLYKITYPNPYLHCLYVELVNSYCFHCLRQLSQDNQQRCPKCRFVVFCNAQCQQACQDQFHNFECPLIARCFPKAPVTHTIFFARLLYRLRNEKIDIYASYESKPMAPRTWKNLISHQDAVKNNPSRMSKFEILKNMLSDYFRDPPPEVPVPQYTDDELFIVYCKKAVNSHGVFNQYGDCIGESLDLNASIYDHSCRPNLSITYDGMAITFSLLNKNIKDPMQALKDPARVFVSYVELALSRTRRRRLLKERYFFHCQCERCLDLEDDQMTSIKCANPKCDQPLIGITEDGVPVNITCPLCRTVRTAADVRQCQIMMRVIEKLTENWREIPNGELSIDLNKTAPDIFKKSMAMYERCKSYLHDTNLYLTDLRLTYLYWSMRTKCNFDVSLKLALESTRCVRLCYPNSHKLLGFHLLKIVYLYIATDEDYEKAKSYLDEATKIMRIWFNDGEHQVCKKLKSLGHAFDGILNKGEKVEKDEILALMKFY